MNETIAWFLRTPVPIAFNLIVKIDSNVLKFASNIVLIYIYKYWHLGLGAQNIMENIGEIIQRDLDLDIGMIN